MFVIMFTGYGAWSRGMPAPWGVPAPRRVPTLGGGAYSGRLLLWAVRILLECILVAYNYWWDLRPGKSVAAASQNVTDTLPTDLCRFGIKE